MEEAEAEQEEQEQDDDEAHDAAVAAELVAGGRGRWPEAALRRAEGLTSEEEEGEEEEGEEGELKNWTTVRLGPAAPASGSVSEWTAAEEVRAY